MSEGEAKTAIFQHRVLWGEHEQILEHWRKHPPTHPENPRYRAIEVEVDGEYSWFESAMNVLRDRGWIDAPPAEYKWAVLTVHCKAPRCPSEKFSSLSSMAYAD